DFHFLWRFRFVCLQVKEALDVVQSLLELHHSTSPPVARVLTLITGIGKHSIGGVARLRPAVYQYAARAREVEKRAVVFLFVSASLLRCKRYLQERGYRVAAGRGTLMVDLPGRKLA